MIAPLLFTSYRSHAEPPTWQDSVFRTHIRTYNVYIDCIDLFPPSHRSQQYQLVTVWHLRCIAPVRAWQ